MVFCTFNITSVTDYYARVGTIKLTKFMTIPFSKLNREAFIYIMLNIFLTVLSIMY